MKKKIAIFLLAFFVFLSFRNAEPLFYTPRNWQKPVYDFSKNKLTQAQINIGKALFYDNILSKDNTVSCASCHSSYTAFAHTDHAVSHGIYNRTGNRNAPALQNLAWQPAFMMDGAINHLDMQALAPITNADEMDEKFEHVLAKLNQSKAYKTLYYKAYKDSAATGEKTLKCMSQFLLTLISANSKYDRVQQKKEKFTPQENNGYLLFQKNCGSCHAEPLFSTYEFATNGLKVDTFYNDLGRFNVTKKAADSLKFKIPSLRNIEYTAPYMHDGRFKKLSQVLNHYTNTVEKYL